jgi:hypothetical protein
MDVARLELASAALPSPIEAYSPRVNFIVGNVPQPPKVRTFDHTFTLLAILSAAATVADIEMTANCLKTVQNCRESNFLLGSDPGRARLYGVNVPIYAGQIMLSRVLRRRFPERKLWTIPLLSSAGTHAVGVASNLRVR